MPLPYFQFYARDWLASSSVNAMTLAEQGAYIALLARMWEHGEGRDGCYVPADDAWLARALHVTRREWKGLRETLVDAPDAVFYVEDGRLYNRRLVAEWQKASAKSGKASEAAGARWEQSGRTADAKRTHSGRRADAMPPIDADADADADPRPANAGRVDGPPAAAPPTPGAAPGAEDAPPPRETEPAAPASPTPSEVLALWNEVAAAADPPLPRADKLTPERAKHLRARQAEGGRDLDWWRGYFGRIAASAFCRGGGREGWKATFTWAIRSEEVVARVAEGAYDDRAGPLARASPQERERMEGIAGTLRAAHDAETGGRSP